MPIVVHPSMRAHVHTNQINRNDYLSHFYSDRHHIKYLTREAFWRLVVHPMCRYGG